jgi:hypothetical protein
MASTSDIDFDICQAEINWWLKTKKVEKDPNGDYRELPDEIRLPFTCRPELYDKLGQEMTTFIVDRNAHRYTWGYFWLTGEHTVAKNSFFGSNLIGGKSARRTV